MKKIIFVFVFVSTAVCSFAAVNQQTDVLKKVSMIELNALSGSSHWDGCVVTGQTPSPFYDDMVYCSATAPTCAIAQDMVNRCLLEGLFEIPSQP